MVSDLQKFENERRIRTEERQRALRIVRKYYGEEPYGAWLNTVTALNEGWDV